MKLSIIIPVYNVEEYVAKCIHSCLHQNLPQKDYEIIIINDGSTDSSLKIVEQFEAANIHVYTQENAGLSAARNNGLLKAQGEYVWFVDSDDWIEENCLKRVLQEAKNHNILAFGSINHNGERHEIEQYGDDLVNVKSGKEFLLTTKCHFLMGAPFYIFNRQFLLDNNLFFYPGIFHEDGEFTPRALYLAKTLKVSSGTYYQRLNRLGSITRTENPKRAYDIFIVVEKLRTFSDEYVDERDVKRGFNILCSLFLNIAMSVLSSLSSITWKEWNQKFHDNKLFVVFLKSGSLKYVTEGLLLFVFKCNPVAIYKMYKMFM